jgi:glycosyltransferase involved in cell wall biosynthesis
MIRVAILTNSLNYTDGVSNHIHDLMQGFRQLSAEIEFCIITAENNAADKFSKLGIEIIVWPEFRHSKRSVLNFAKSAYKLLRFVQDRQINILHSHNHYHANIAAACQFLVNVSTVQTNHGIIPQGGLLPHLTADRYIIINKHIEEYLKKYYPIKYQRAKFIRCGIPEIKAPKVQNPKVIFITAGRFVKEKGFDTYIKAVNELPKEIFFKAEFYLAGDGEEKQALLELNTALGAKVSYMGNINNLQERFFETDVLINPSRSKSEGFPRTIVEAAFAKNLIVTSNFLGVTDDLVPDKDCLLFAIDDVSDLKNKINMSIEKPQFVSVLRENFEKKAKILFSVELMVELTQRLYKEVIIN